MSLKEIKIMGYERFYRENFKSLLYIAMLVCLAGVVYSLFVIGGQGGMVMTIMLTALEFFFAGVAGALLKLTEGNSDAG